MGIGWTRIVYLRVVAERRDKLRLNALLFSRGRAEVAIAGDSGYRLQRRTVITLPASKLNKDAHCFVRPSVYCSLSALCVKRNFERKGICIFVTSPAIHRPTHEPGWPSVSKHQFVSSERPGCLSSPDVHVVCVLSPGGPTLRRSAGHPHQ